jgi:hypothetical protein
LFLNQKDLEKNNKEIKKLQLLFNNKELKEESQIKLEDNKLLKELNNMKLNIKQANKLKSQLKDKLNLQVKSLFQLNLDLLSLLEFEVSIN